MRASVVWTGSNNFTNDGVKYDEVTMRIASRPAFLQYTSQFAFITRTPDVRHLRLVR